MPGLSTIAGLLGCLGAVGLFGFVERRARDAARRAVPVRVHVNGTRGKSTVTRMIWAALGEAAVPAVAKTTGTSPRLLLPDGTEHPIRRRAPANIREQIWLLRQARRAGARAVVVECMAVDPTLQWVAEHDMIGATLGVITNVRTDHLESMGQSLDSIARSLANTIPRSGVLVLGGPHFADLFTRHAAALGTRVVVARAAPGGEVAPGSAPMSVRCENEATALAACRELGVDETTALRGIRRAPDDPGTMKRGALIAAGRTVQWLDLTSANDPESFDALGDGGDSADSSAPALVVFNHRADRPLRLEAFARGSERFRDAARVIVTGDVPAWTSRRRLARLCPALPVEIAPRRRLAASVAAALTMGDAAVVRLEFAGNTKGLEVGSVLNELRAAAAADGAVGGGGVRP